jgi:DNA-binding response OmpR family regulator
MMRRVLVVDDEPPIRTIVRRYLEADGFAVDEAGDGESALGTCVP